MNPKDAAKKRAALDLEEEALALRQQEELDIRTTELAFEQQEQDLALQTAPQKPAHAFTSVNKRNAHLHKRGNNTTSQSERATTPAPAVKIHISIKTHLNQRRKFLVCKTATIKDVKGLYQEAVGVPAYQQRFLYQGHLLADHRTLLEYGICDGAEIVIVHWLRGD